ncbi:PREDICTED: transcriptional corepressor SEUSS-like [Tarenaya hassleriana]|uniref:transcriptional corepressor SEUSS-like n=1 Tax=Tarenaya hassleriana TaxID=28532 RepID=UPI00053C45C3|nr:PREDICTED: transcriptional corepressor SEUSS-like [Tarenaya hassleriana]
MVPSGPPTPVGGGQPVPPSLLRSNSGVLGGQGGQLPSQPTFASVVSPRTQFGNNINMSLLGNAPNMSSLLNNQSFGNDVPSSVISGQRVGMEMGGCGSDPLSSMVTTGSSVQAQGHQFSDPSSNQFLSDQQQNQQMEPQNFQHGQQSIQQQQFPAIRGGGLAGVGPVKLEPGQVSADQHGQLQQQQQQLLRNLGPVKLEQQQLQAMRSLAQVKLEPQHTEQSLFLQQQQHRQQQQQQQQQFLQLSGQSPRAQMNLFHQQRLMQLQQQQQQLLKAMPQQRPQLPQQFQQQSLPLRPLVKPVYEPGMGAQRLTQYMYRQQHRPEDNNIEFWRKFVAEYFAPNAKKRWCVSMYGSGRQTTGVFSQDGWHCEICNRKPGRGFEATVEVLPRLFEIKYESGTLEELLYVDMPRESQNSSGQIVLEYAKATQESVFEHLRVVRDGQLRIVFSPDLKICLWEFCARRHEELIPRRLLTPQVSQLGSAAQKYQQATQNASSDTLPELQSNCNMFVASARQLAKAIEVPLVNDLGYTKRYVRCLQISEVVNSMKDLIDYSRETETGPIESLAKFPRRTSSSSALPGPSQTPSDQLRQPQPQPQQQAVAQNANSNQSSGQGGAMQVNPNNGVTSVNNSFNAASASVSTSTSSIAGLIHQNSMNSRQQNSANNPNSPYGGNSLQMPSPSSSSTIQHSLPSFQSPTSSSNNNSNLPQPSQNGLPSVNHRSVGSSPAIQQQPGPSPSEAEANNSQSSVQKILHEIMMNNQIHSTGGMVGSGSYVYDGKAANGVSPVNNPGVLGGGNGLVMNGPVNSIGGGVGFGTMGVGGGNGNGNGIGIRAAMANSNNGNTVMNARMGMMGRDQNMGHQQQEMGNHLLGTVNGFNNFQFDWSG